MMASAVNTVDTSREICICVLCKDVFTSPKLLQCLHTFCAPCLEDYVEKSLVQNGQKHFPCPTCGTEVELPSGATSGKYCESFADDEFFAKIVEVINATRDGKVCDICERREENAKAENWCTDCSEALCGMCNRVHLHGKLTSSHAVVSIEEMRSIPLETLMKKNNKVLCGKHNEIITLYCVDCKDPLCVQCMAVNHRRCENVVTVSDAMSTQSDVQEVLSKLKNLQGSLESADGINSGKSPLDDSLETARSQVMSICNSLCEKIREEQVKVLNDLEAKASSARQLIQDRIEPKRSGLKSLQSANDRLKHLMRFGNDVEVLMAYNHIGKHMNNVQGAFDIDDDISVKLSFRVDRVFEKFTKEFDCLGEITVHDRLEEEGMSQWGVTCTSAEDIIVTDSKNRRIQKFSKVGDLVDYVQLEDEPRDITLCSHNDYVAITMVGKLIIYLSTKSTMQLIKRTKTEKQYDGICYSDIEAVLVVTSLKENCVDVIQVDGTIIRSIHRDSEGATLFAAPRYVSTSAERAIVVSDVEKNVIICFSMDGKPLFNYTPNGPFSVKRPQGVCFDKIGNLFVADFGNNRVQLLTNEGDFQRHVLGEESGLFHPVALQVSTSNRMVIVQGDGMVKVFSYS